MSNTQDAQTSSKVRRLSRIVVVPVATSTLLLTGLVTSAPVAAAAPARPASFPSGAVFNTPRNAGGSTANQYKWHNYVTSMINGTPKGAAINISTYSWDHPASLAALTAADARGVRVRLVLWEERAKSPEIIQLSQALNDGQT